MENLEGLSLRELAEKLMEVRNRQDEVKVVEKELNALESDIEARMIDCMINEEQVSTVKYADIASFSLATSQYPSIKDDTKFFAYLKETGQEAMAKYTVNANTLRGWWNKKIDVDLKAEDIGLEVYTRTKLNIRKV